MTYCANMIGKMRKECTILFFVFEQMNLLPTYLSMEGKDQNAVVRLKDFQKYEWVHFKTRALRLFIINGRKLNQDQQSTMRG